MSTDQTKQSTPLDQSQPLAAVGDALPSTGASSSTESVVDGTKQSEHSQSNSKASEDDEDEEDADDQPVNPLSDDDSDDDADGPAVKDDIQLGFLEEALHPRGMLRDYFPCKVGGKPAWLNPKNIPTTQQLTCAHCKNTLTFLMQVSDDGQRRVNGISTQASRLTCRSSVIGREDRVRRDSPNRQTAHRVETNSYLETDILYG